MTTNGFNFFEGATTETQTAPKITVRRGGQLVLTEATVNMLGSDTTHVQLGFNPETKAIGIRSASAEAQGSYRLRSQKSGLSRLVNGKRFFAHHNLSASKARSFKAESFGDGIVGFTLTPTENGTEKDSETETAPAKKSRRQKSSS